MGLFNNDEKLDEEYQKILELVKDYTPEEFARWLKAIKKAYDSYHEFKRVENTEGVAEQPSDDIEKAEVELADYIETENK